MNVVWKSVLYVKHCGRQYSYKHTPPGHVVKFSVSKEELYNKTVMTARPFASRATSPYIFAGRRHRIRCVCPYLVPRATDRDISRESPTPRLVTDPALTIHPVEGLNDSSGIPELD